MFHKSTRAIVTGSRRPPATSGDSQVEPSTTPTEGNDVKQSPKHTPFQWPRWALAVAIGVILVFLIVGTLDVVSLALRKPTATPRPASDQVILSINADAALSDLAAPGDVLGLYASDGQRLPGLQYLQIYRADAGNILILAEDLQASVLARQKETLWAVLVVHNDPARAGELLELQRRINHPTIFLDMPSAITLAPGESAEIDCQTSIEPKEAVLPKITWSSSDPTVADVTDGTVAANGVGTAIITAVCGDVSASCTVTVEVPLASITLDRTKFTMAVGDTHSLAAAPEPADATDFAVTWHSDNPDIATIDPDGVVTAIAPGTATVTAACGEVSASCTITVGVHAELVQLDKTELTMAVGSTKTMTARIYPGENVIDPGSFTSSNSEIVTVAEDGTVTAIASGTATITFRCGEAVAVCTVTVTDPQ